MILSFLTLFFLFKYHKIKKFIDSFKFISHNNENENINNAQQKHNWAASESSDCSVFLWRNRWRTSNRCETALDILFYLVKYVKIKVKTKFVKLIFRNKIINTTGKEEVNREKMRKILLIILKKKKFKNN